MVYLLEFAVIQLLSISESIFKTFILQITPNEIFPRKTPDIYKQAEICNRLAVM